MDIHTWIAGALALVGALPAAHADTVTIQADHCVAAFDVPREVHPATDAPRPGYLYQGTGGRTNVSLYVADPWCAGDTSTAAAAACLQQNLDNLPGLMKASWSVETRANGALAAYVQYVRFGTSAVKVMHANLLFKCGSQWADLHMSIVKPTVDEIATLLALGDHLKVTE